MTTVEQSGPELNGVGADGADRGTVPPAGGCANGARFGTDGPDSVPRSDDLAYAAACAEVGARFILLPASAEPVSRDGLTAHAAARVGAARLRLPDGAVLTVLAPPPTQLARHLDDLAGGEGRNGWPDALAVTTPRRLRAALRAAVAVRTEARVRGILAREEPQLSASTAPSIAFRTALSIGILALAYGLVSGPSVLPWAIFVTSALVFHVTAGLRLMVAVNMRPVAAPEAAPPLPPAALPFYTVMVCLYREAGMVPTLAAALDRLAYPRDRLEVLVLLEADDAETRAAAEAGFTAPHVDILVVPPGRPRTKPRALAYGLAFARGDLVAVFDAEDRPAPDQLLKAAAHLVGGGPSVACVQGELRIDGDDRLIQKLFAIDYAALFSGMLPWLARQGAPLPLGGTSNHIKRKALLVCRGWDPYNVTEDADLGIRLQRFGFRSDVLASHTREESPDRFADWLPQRTRWLKGWMITWLVHSRRPGDLVRECGFKAAALFHATAFTQVVAPLVHPLGMVAYGLHLAGVKPVPDLGGAIGAVLLGLAGFAILVGYGAAFVIARRAVRAIGRPDLLPWTFALPVQWMLVSIAAWKALFELIFKPHYWAKTTHRSRPVEKA